MKFIHKASQLLFLPCIEFICLRVFLHHGLGLSVGFVGMTDYDLVFPFILSFFVFVYCLEETAPLTLSFNPRGFITHLVFLTLFILLSLAFSSLSKAGGNYFFVLWVLIGISVFGSALFTWITPAEFQAHPKRSLLPWAVLAGSSKIIARNLLGFLWLPTAEVTGRSVCSLATVWSSRVDCQFHQLSGTDFYQMISHPLLTISIGLGCSGLEGIFYFLFVAVLIFMSRWDDFGTTKASLFLLSGIMGMFWLNIFRILFILIGGVAIIRVLGPDKADSIISGLFHGSIGWLLYGAYFCFHMTVWRHFIQFGYKTKSPQLKTP